jgi:hypothetical protein
MQLWLPLQQDQVSQWLRAVASNLLACRVTHVQYIAAVEVMMHRDGARAIRYTCSGKVMLGASTSTAVAMQLTHYRQV